MLRGTPAWRRMKPARSRVRIILVDRRRGHAKVALHLPFGGRAAMHARIGVDKRQILALLGRKGFCGSTHAGHPIQLFIPALIKEARMNVRYRVELSQTERGELTELLSGGKHAARKLKRAQILLAADAGASDEEIARSVGVGGSTVYGPSAVSCLAIWRPR